MRLFHGNTPESHRFRYVVIAKIIPILFLLFAWKWLFETDRLPSNEFLENHFNSWVLSYFIFNITVVLFYRLSGLGEIVVDYSYTPPFKRFEPRYSVNLPTLVLWFFCGMLWYLAVG